MYSFVKNLPEWTAELKHVGGSSHNNKYVFITWITWIWYLRLLLKSVKIIQIWLKSDKNIGHFALRCK